MLIFLSIFLSLSITRLSQNIHAARNMALSLQLHCFLPVILPLDRLFSTIGRLGPWRMLSDRLGELITYVREQGVREREVSGAEVCGRELRRGVVRTGERERERERKS